MADQTEAKLVALCPYCGGDAVRAIHIALEYVPVDHVKHESHGDPLYICEPDGDGAEFDMIADGSPPLDCAECDQRFYTAYIADEANPVVNEARRTEIEFENRQLLRQHAFLRARREVAPDLYTTLMNLVAAGKTGNLIELGVLLDHAKNVVANVARAAVAR